MDLLTESWHVACLHRLTIRSHPHKLSHPHSIHGCMDHCNTLLLLLCDRVFVISLEQYSSHFNNRVKKDWLYCNFTGTDDQNNQWLSDTLASVLLLRGSTAMVDELVRCCWIHPGSLCGFFTVVLQWVQYNTPNSLNEYKDNFLHRFFLQHFPWSTADQCDKSHEEGALILTSTYGQTLNHRAIVRKYHMNWIHYRQTILLCHRKHVWCIQTSTRCYHISLKLI